VGIRAINCDTALWLNARACQYRLKLHSFADGKCTPEGAASPDVAVRPPVGPPDGHGVGAVSARWRSRAGWRDPDVGASGALRIAIGHLAQHHSRDINAAHGHHRPNGERLSRREAVAHATVPWPKWSNLSVQSEPGREREATGECLGSACVRSIIVWRSAGRCRCRVCQVPLGGIGGVQYP
jgi:hypothetical protein